MQEAEKIDGQLLNVVKMVPRTVHAFRVYSANTE
jgi:hypothetical protein